MSYASVAKHNIEGGDHGAQPDPNLLEGHSAAATAEEPHGNVQVVDSDEAERIRQGIEHASEHAQDTANEVHLNAQQAASNAERDVKRAADDAHKRGQEAMDDAREAVDDAADKGKQFLDDAEAKGKQWAKDAQRKGKEFKAEAEKRGSEFKKDAEKEAKKLQRKASELDKDARETARKYPVATAGLIGAINLAVVGSVGLWAWSNKDLPRWDRRAVTATVLGLGAWFGSQGLLGWHEYEENKRETGRGF
ncbi:hypothetical protein OIV83_003351 [Microbotryomycetes sp. JL201]|nr:hypothetical protein OIV83_003351 [Microbotryomycetes sp. JL201]